MVNCHRALCIGFTCKECEPDIVIGTSVDELHSHLLGGFYSVLTSIQSMMSMPSMFFVLQLSVV